MSTSTKLIPRPKTERVDTVVAPRRLWRPLQAVKSTPFTFIFGISVASLLIVIAIASPLLGLPDPGSTTLTDRFLPPGTAGHLLGTDQLGRDVLSRTLSGARWSLSIGVVATSIGVFIGVCLGVSAAWAPRLVAIVLSRAIDVGMSFPYLVIAITIVAILGRGFGSLALTLGLVCWPPVARVIYAETLGLKEREFVLASRLLGVRGFMTVLSHVLPALRPTIFVMAAFIFAEMLISESGMSFLGLGAPLGSATWGNDLSESRAYLANAPWMMIAPAAGIVLAVVSANFIGDGLTARAAAKGARVR